MAQNQYQELTSNLMVLPIWTITITIYSPSRLMTKYQTIIITLTKTIIVEGLAYLTKIIGHSLLSPNPTILITLIPQCHHNNNNKSITWYPIHNHSQEIHSPHASCNHLNTDLNRLGMTLNRRKRIKCFRKLSSPNSWMESITKRIFTKSIITKRIFIKRIFIKRIINKRIIKGIIIQPINGIQSIKKCIIKIKIKQIK